MEPDRPPTDVQPSLPNDRAAPDGLADLATRCATHPDVETYLRCGRCGRPICPRCLVQTPVGARCRDCARLRRLPTYQVGPTHVLRAALAGLAVALLGGIVLRSVPFLGFFLLAGTGYAVGEAVTWAANRKRGPLLAAVAVVCFVVGVLFSPLLAFALAGAGLQPALLPVLLAQVVSPFFLLGLALGGIIAASRVR